MYENVNHLPALDFDDQILRGFDATEIVSPQLDDEFKSYDNRDFFFTEICSTGSARMLLDHKLMMSFDNLFTPGEFRTSDDIIWPESPTSELSSPSFTLSDTFPSPVLDDGASDLSLMSPRMEDGASDLGSPSTAWSLSPEPQPIHLNSPSTPSSDPFEIASEYESSTTSCDTPGAPPAGDLQVESSAEAEDVDVHHLSEAVKNADEDDDDEQPSEDSNSNEVDLLILKALYDETPDSPRFPRSAKRKVTYIEDEDDEPQPGPSSHRSRNVKRKHNNYDEEEVVFVPDEEVLDHKSSQPQPTRKRKGRKRGPVRGRIPCPLDCGKDFTRQHDVARHIRGKAHQNCQERCPDCGLALARNDSVKRHRLAGACHAKKRS